MSTPVPGETVPTSSPTQPDAAHQPGLSPARRHLAGLFFMLGITFSAGLARIPTIKELLDITEAQLGLLFITGSIGGLVAITVVGVLIVRFGGRRVFDISSFLMGSGVITMGVGAGIGSVPVFAAGLFGQGIAFALGNVPQNLAAAAVERRLKRTIIPQFHAAYSIGAVAGAGLGSICSALQVSVLHQYLATAAVIVAWRLYSTPKLIMDADPTPRIASTRRGLARLRPSARAGGGSMSVWREPLTLLLGVLIISAPFSEGAANDWLPLAIVQGFDRPESIGALVLSIFLLAMTIVRLAGSRLIDRLGGTRVLQLSAISSVIGVLLLVYAPNFPLAICGVVAWGAGAALVYPIGIAAASRDPLRAAGRVSVVSAFGSMASLVAPPVIGAAAHAHGARTGIVIVAGVVLLSLVLSPVVDKMNARSEDRLEK